MSMRFFIQIAENLNEGKRIHVAAKTHIGSIDTVVIETTIFRDIKAMVERANEVRGIIANDRLYIWPAWDALHVQIASELDLKDASAVWFVREGEDPFPEGADWDVSDDNPVHDGVRLVPGRGALDSELIKRLFSI